MIESTYAMIKPHAVADLLTGKVVDFIESNGFEVVKMEKKHLSKSVVEEFYGEHKDRPFFGDLVKNLIAGPIVALELKKENAIADWRKVIGATNPTEAEAGTLRALYGKSIDFNVVHGSDSSASAERELGLIFANSCSIK